MRGKSLVATVVALAVVIVASVAAAADPAASPTPAAAVRAPLAEQLSPWLAVVVGSVGSAAYLIALWVGLVGTAEGKERILAHFQKLWGLKVPLFVSGGGAVAMVFQLPEGKLIPVQAFIIGCTWPAVVSNYLSGRQSGEGEAQARDALKRQQDTDQLLAAMQQVPQSPPSSAQAEFERLIAVVEKSPTAAEAPSPGHPTGQSQPPTGSGGGKTGAT